MNNISILGCGWLGKALASEMIADGFHVKGSTTTVDKLTVLEDLGIEAYLVDISENEEYDAFLASDILIVAITSKVVEAFKALIAQIQDAPIQKVILISSTSVYPTINKVMTEEDDVLNTPLMQIESLFRENTLFETTVLRFAGLYGAERHPSNWFLGRKIPHPEGYVNMIHREDCIQIIFEIIQQNCWNITLNACANHHPTRRVFYTKAKLDKGMDIPEFNEDKPLEWKVISPEQLIQKLKYNFIHNNLLELKP